MLVKKFLIWYNTVANQIGVSPSGKATDSDSVTSLVQIHLPLPRKTPKGVFFRGRVMDLN